MKKGIVPVLALLALSPLWAANIDVSVVDADLGIPLEGVKLQGQGIVEATTNAEGYAILTLSETGSRVLITATLMGYEQRTLWIDPGSANLTIKLSIKGVIEGRELVVESAKPRKTDEQAGVSQVATREEIKNTAEIGIVEDLMSTIKLMPGVGYVGGWDAMPSIRGGDPLETTAVLDGAYVLYPYQWGGAFSIFDPDMVDSAKLSNGLISAQYGRVMSGLLEVNSKTPKNAQPQFDAAISTTGLDFYAQGLMGPDLGLFVGGKITWMDISFALAGQSGNFNTVPYMRNGYAKISWKPSDRFEWFFNSFIGSDGVGEKLDSTTGSDGISTTGSFTWNGLTLIETTGVKLFATDTSLFNFIASYNYMNGNDAYVMTLNGSRNYDQNFVDANQAILGGQTGFTLNNLVASNGSETDTGSTYQGKASWDWEVQKGQVLSFGLESVLETTSEVMNQSNYSDYFSSPDAVPQFTDEQATLDIRGDRQLASGGYGTCEFNVLSGLITGEAGLRVDHFYLFNDEMHIDTYPTINPRLRVEITPWKNRGWIKSLGITAGSGLYAQMPLVANLFDSSMNLADFSISPTRAWFNVAGIDLHGADDWNISLEGYYKYYFDRLYVVGDSSSGTETFSAHNDGQGYALGADLLVQKRLGRYWDGWLTYSYSMARYLNPVTPAYPGESTVATEGTSGDPLGVWYYPYYQRFHTINLVLDWKPVPGFTATLTGSLATGAPKAQVGQIESYPAYYTDPITGQQTILERYAQSSEYSDTLRNDISCPVNLKLDWSGYYTGTKLRWEYYIGVENIFANLYSPRTNPAFDPFTGQALSGSGQADFTIGFPIPSFGYKISY